jgi:superfamily I DNA/RNA helicase
VEFRIADSFLDSLTRLTGEEQKAAKTTAFDLQASPSNPSHNFHKLDGAKDKNFWSVRVSADIRLIVHRTQGSLLLCYVNHHDKAYAWAERRKLETHPKTGAAQFVEIRETIREVVVPTFVHKAPIAAAKPRLFDGKTDDELLSLGVPAEWLSDVKAANEDSILEVAEHLPAEAAESLLQLATGDTGTPVPAEMHYSLVLEEPARMVAEAAKKLSDPFEHPDAQRRFRVIKDSEELEQALKYPWDKWTVFLHPEQREVVERDYAGPARVAGTAGTGKTIVALHRAVTLARKHADARVLLATFSDPLAHTLEVKLRRLLGSEPRLGERIDVNSMEALAIRLHQSLLGPVKLAPEAEIRDKLRAAAIQVGEHKFSVPFLATEWKQVADAWQLETWEAYRDVARLGRKTRLPEARRKVLWAIFEKVRAELNEAGRTTLAAVFTSLASRLSRGPVPFDYAVIDEAQDISVSQLRFLAALGRDRPNALFFAGDLGQRIFQQPFSWKSLGVDVRGRSRTLRVNYRTSHQIRQQADCLLGPEVSDVDGITENRRNTVSVFNGPVPDIRVTPTSTKEVNAVASWLKQRLAEDFQAHEIGIIVRSAAQLERAESVVREADVQWKVLDEHVAITSGFVSICTMHLAKGLEFRAVAVMACDDEVLPLQERITAVGDDADLQEAYETERHLLYVACTRARDQLLITATAPASEFLDDLEMSDGTS